MAFLTLKKEGSLVETKGPPILPFYWLRGTDSPVDSNALVFP